MFQRLYQAASRNLIDLRNKLGDTIEDGAPDFKNYINTYSQGAAPIQGMKYLQGLNLTNGFGNQTLGRLDQAIKQIDKQRSLSGARPADSPQTVLELQRRCVREYTQVLMQGTMTLVGAIEAATD